MSVVCVDENFAYAIESTPNRTLKIVGVNPGKYNASNPNWGVFPTINLVYTGPTSPYNGFGVSDNAYAIVEIADNAFNHSANQCPFTEGPLNLTSNIVRIGANAFNSVKITGVLTIPSSVTYIGNQAFSNLLIDETVFENETNSDLLGGVVDSTRVSSQNKSARMAADTVLNTLKVAKANPTMTGVTTISNAAISNAAIVNASVNIANVTTATLVSVSIANMGVGGAASFSGTVSASGQWNYTVQPKYNGMGLATQSYIDSKISIMNGTEALTSTLNTLNKIASAIGEDPNYGLHVSQSQSTIAQSTVIETLLRSSQITSLSSALSSATLSLQTVDASVASGIVSGSTVRSSQIASLSSALSSATLSLQTVDTTLLSTNVSNTAARSSQITSLSSALSTFTSDRQANDIAMTSGIASLVFRRNIDVASVSTALSSGVSSLQSTDVSLSSAIASASIERTNAVSSISAILSSAVPSLQTADTAFLNALGSRTSDRVAAMTSLSTATTSHVSALQAAKSTILPQISGGGLSQDGTTSTVFNLLGINVGESLTFVKTGGTFSINDKITILYSATDYLKGTVTNVVGSNVTFTVTFKTTSAVETQIYSTTGPSGHTDWLDAGNYIAPLSSFIASSNYVITTMSTQVYAYIYSANGALFNMNLLNDSNVTLATSNNLSYSTTEMEYLCAFNTAFVPQNSTIKQQLVFNKYIKIRVSFNVSGAAYTTIKGYAVPYSSGVVQIEVPGTAQSARISAMASLSGGVASMLLSQSTVNTSISSAIFNASNARSSAITALSIDKSASVSSLQSVSRALSSTQSTAVSDRISNVASLSNALYGNVSSLTSVNASNSTQLSIGIGNRSAQIINAVNSLVNGAPSTLDTLFEIANALTTGPSMYTTISNTDSSITSNTGARSSQIASLSSALSSATLSLQTVDTALLFTHASNTGARSSQIASHSSALSSATLSLQTVDTAILSTHASNTAARSSHIESLSSALSSATLSLQTVDTALLSIHASNTAARSSHIESLSNSIVGLVSTQVSFSGSISSANSAETSTLILNVSSLSSLLSTLVTTLSGADTSLSNAFTSLSNSTQLSTLANLTEVDASVAGIMGLSTIVALDTLGKIASAINLQPDIGTVLTSMTNAKGDVSSVSSISTAATSKTTQFSLSQLADAVSLKVSVSTTTSLQSVISGLTTSFGVLQTDVASLMSSTAVNSIVTADIVKTTRDLDELYVKNGFVNPDGSINYKINHLANPVINPGSSSTLTFAIDGNHQLTGIRQVAAVRFDSLQTTMKYTNRGTEFTVSSSAFTNRVYTFSIESSSIADYNNNATEIVVTGQETALRLAPLSSLTIPKLALSNYTYAAPTVQTPYAATTWNDTTGKISQVLRFNFESDVQKIYIDDSNGSLHDVAGTTEKVVTLEYYPGASGTVIVYALNSASKLRSPSLMLSNVYNDYPQYAAPVLVGGTNAISLSGSTCTYSATFSSDANVVEVHAYDAGTSTYSKVQDLTPATGNQFSVSRTYDVSRIGQPLFKLKSATSASKRASDFSTVVNCDPFTFPLPVISSNLSYTNLNTDPKSFSVNATYAVHPLATVVQVINSGTGGPLMSPNPTVSNGSVAITFNFTEAQALAGMSFYVKINTNSVGLESSSVAQALKSQYDAPVIVAGTKVITQPSATELSYTAQFTSASSDGLIVYDADGVTHLANSTGSSSPFSLSLSYNISKVGSVVFKVASKATVTIRQSALVNIVAEDIPQFSIPVLQTSASYVKNGSVYTASMTYVISGTTQVSAVRILNASDGITSVTNATTQSVSASGGNVVVLITVDFTTPLSIVVVAEANAYGKQSIASTHHALTGEHDAPAIVAGTKTITLSGSTYTYTANYTSASTAGIKVYDSAGTTLLQTVTTPGSGTFTVVQTYDASKIGQPAFKLSSKATTEMRESALITVSGEDIPAHVAPVISGGITYGTSGSDQTAQMNYTVSSRVDTVNVLKPDGSALPAGASFIVSTTGTSRVITVTFPNSIAPVTVAVFAELNAYGKRSVASASQTLLGLHAAPVIVSGTKTLSVSNLFSYSNVTTTFPYTLSNFPVLGSLSSWDMSVNFRSTDKAGMFRAIIGAHDYSPGARGWALWINNSNRFQWGWLNWGINPDIVTSSIVVSTNVNYYLIITKTTTTIKFDLTNLDNSTTQSQTISHSNATIGTTGTVTIGGWISSANDNFVGTISSVVVGPSTYTYTANYTSASTTGIKVYDATGTTLLQTVTTPGSGTFAVTTTYDDSKIGTTAFQLSSNGDTSKRESALVNITGEDIPTHPALVASGGITYGTSGSDHTAQLDYTAHYRVDNLTVLKSDLTPLPAAASFTQSILSTVGTTRTFRIMVTYSNTVAPLTIAVVGLTNAYGKQSAASASQSLLVPYAAPTISKTITLSGNTYTHNATYTSVSTAGVNVYNAVKIWNLTRTSNMLGSFNFTPTDNPSNVAFHIDFRSDRVVFGYYDGSWPVLNTVYDLHNLSLPTAFTVSFNPVSGFTLTYGPSNTVVTFPNYLNIATLAGVSDTVKSNWYDGPHFVIGTADLMPMGTSLNPQSGSSPFTITSKYDVSQIGQTLSKVSSKGDSTNRESALVSVLCEDIPTHANPVISGGITYGISGSDQTAQMNYTVSSVVDTVKVLKPDGSALPAGASFTQTIVSTTGASRVISVIVTFPNSIAPVTVAVFAELNAYGKRSVASASQTLLGLHAAPVIVAGTKAVSSSIQMFPVYTTGAINTNNSFISSNVSMIDSANYPVMLSVTFNLSSFASSGGCIIGKYLLGGSSDYFIYWDITPFGNGVGVVFRMATGNGTQTTNTNISGDTLLNGVDYTLSMKRTNDTSLTFKIVNATTNAVVCADQTYTFSSTRLNNYLITDAGLSIGYANSVYAEIYYSVLQLVGYVKNVKIEKNMQVLNYTANYTSASTAGIKVYDSAGTTLLQTVTTPGSGTFTVVQTYDASKIGQTAFRLSSNSTSAMRESALITVSGEDIQVHNSPTRAGDAIYGTSGSNYTAQFEYSRAYSAPRSVDELIVLKADGSALPSGASYTQSILNTVTFTGSDVIRFFRVIVTFTDAVSPLNIMVESAANMYGKQSTEGTPYMLISPYDAPVIVAGTKTITLSGSTYTYTANYTSASTAGIKVYDSAGTTLLQTVTTPGSGTFTVTATYDASKIGQTVFVLKSAASATRSESVSALTVVGEDIPAHVAPIIVADSLAINSTIPSIYATTSSMSFPSRTYVSNTATVLQNFPTIIGDTWSGWDIHVFFTPTGGGSSIRPIVGSYSYNTDGSGSDWRIYIAANNYIYWAWSGEEMLIGEAIGEITLNHSYYFRARKLNNSFYYEFTLVNITTNVMAFNQRTSYDPTFSPTVRVGTGNPVTVGQWKYNANQMFIGTISSVQVGSYTATMSYTVNYLVDALNILKSDGSALPANVTVQQSVVSTIGTSRVISVALGFLDLTAPSSIAAFAAANVYGKKSAASTTQTLLGMHAAPVLSGTVAYSGTGPHSASMTYTVASGVTAVSVLKSDLTALPAGASVTTNTVSGTTATLVVSFTDAVAPLGIVVVALANSAARQSPASASHTLLGLPAAPVLSGTVAYSGTGTYSASMTYIVASDVTAVSVLKSDLTALPAGASVTTNTVSGTTATLVVSFTDAVAPLGIVVVALNSAGRQSPASASQTLLGLHSAPVLSGTVVYSGTGPYSASMTYTIASGVTAVSVLKSDLNALPAGASVTTNTVSGTTATLVVSFTDAVAPLGIVVVALANSVARQSPASASQTLSVPVPPPAIARAGTVSSGTLSTLSTFGSTGTGNGQFAYPFGIATDAAGNIYVTDHDNNRVQKFNSAGVHIITFGSQGTGNGQFNLPHGIAIDATGNIYVADSENHRIQKFSSAGAHIITFGSQGTGNGQFNIPLGIAIDASGKILVADAFNNRIQIFTSAGGHIRTIGTGTAGNANGQFNYPSGIAVNATGNIYVADINNSRIQIFTSDGTHVSSFGIQLNPGIGIAIDASGKIVVSDTGNSRIQVFTSAGTHVSSFGSQGTGNGQFQYPRGIAIDASGKIIVADTNNHRIQIVGPPPLPPAIQRAGTLPSGTLSTLSTFGSQGAGNGQFNIPYRIALDASGKIYVVDTNNHRIQIFNSAGTYVSKIGGVQGSGSGHFNYPYGIAIDASGKILVADSDNHRIQVFNSDGTYVSTIGSQGTANGRFNNPIGIAIDASGKILVADAFNHRIQIFTSAGIYVSTIGTGTAGNANGQFNYPKSIAIDASGKILVADSDNHRIQVFNSDGTYDTQFGTYGTTDNGNFRFPSEIAIDASGKILVADGSNHRIQLFTSAGIHVSTIGSQGTGNGQFQYPRGFAIDASGKIIVADTHNHRVQIVGQ